MREYIKNAGPAFKMSQRSICKNDTDFATLEPLVEIPFNQFFSFIDDDGDVYGFDIISFNSLLHTTTPYHELKNLKIRFVLNTNHGEFDNFLNTGNPTIYLDAFWLELEYKDIQKEVHNKLTSKNYFRMNESPEFIFSKSSESTGSLYIFPAVLAQAL